MMLRSTVSILRSAVAHPERFHCLDAVHLSRLLIGRCRQYTTTSCSTNTSSSNQPNGAPLEEAEASKDKKETKEDDKLAEKDRLITEKDALVKELEVQ